MNKLSFALALVFPAVLGSIAFIGCGSESPSDDPAAGQQDGGTDGDPRVTPSCKVGAATCTTSADCCSGNCDPKTKACGASLGKCAAPAAACKTNVECCSFSCTNGACSDKQCAADNGACTADGQCCGGKCTAGACTPLNTTCKTSGNPCGGSGECCSQLCQSGICAAASSFCVQNGDACSADLDCCGGACTKAAGATLGTCGVAAGSGGCTTAGTVCSPGGACNANPCCSRSCEPYAPTGVNICQPPSGCHPTGELCQKDTDCCGAVGLPDGNEAKTTCVKESGATLGRCDQGHKCSPAGSICRLAAFSCQSTDRCCSGTVQQVKTNCVQDNLGIPRCLATTGVDCANPPPAGTACASSADCCNKPCTPNAAGVLVCAGVACQPTGSTCTTTADCCSGEPCNVPAGATNGTCGMSGTPVPPGTDAGTTGGGGTTCSQYGQQCTSSAMCCNGTPCTNGFCITPVN